jgi:glycosyltransferase involved in cell wall biosynthesis
VAHLVRRGGVIVALGESARADWLARGARRAVAIRHGSDPPPPGLAPPSRGEAVVFAGYIGPSKGVDVLLAAWRELRCEVELPLVLAGGADPPHDVWLDALLAEHAHGPNPPRWLGPVPGESDFEEVVARAAVVVLPYRRSSPASGVLVRAMRCGRAIVVTPVPAVDGVVRDGENGLVVPAEDPAALAAAVRRLLAEPETRDRLGTAAAATASERFSWAAHAAGLERAYAAAAESRRQRSGSSSAGQARSTSSPPA